MRQGEASLSLPGRGCHCMRGQLSVARWLSPLGNRVLVLTCAFRCQETAWAVAGDCLFGNATGGELPTQTGRAAGGISAPSNWWARSRLQRHMFLLH